MLEKYKKVVDQLKNLNIFSDSTINDAIQFIESNQNKDSINDKIWSLLNEALQFNAKKHGYSEKQLEANRIIYQIMFAQLVDEGKDRTIVTKLRIRDDINRTDFFGYDSEIVLIPPNDCEYGNQFQDVVIDVESARNKFPIDFEKCTRNGGCVCCIGFNAIRDEKGRLKLKNKSNK